MTLWGFQDLAKSYCVRHGTAEVTYEGSSSQLLTRNKCQSLPHIHQEQLSNYTARGITPGMLLKAVMMPLSSL